MAIQLISFGYKYPDPPQIQYTKPPFTVVFDSRKTVRNPYLEPGLRKLTGLDESVQAFVNRCQGGKNLLKQAVDWINLYNDAIEVIYMGCLAGKHRSVALVELLGKQLAEKDIKFKISHRDIEKD